MRIAFVILTCVLTAGLPAAAGQKESAPQEKPTPTAAPPSEASKTLVPLKVQIVLSRFKGEKKIGSLPYQIGVIANDRAMSSVRMGIEVPVGRGGGSGGVSYRSVGTNIDCLAQSVPGDAYKLSIVAEDTSVLAEAGDKSAAKPQGEPTAVVSDMPAFRTFKSNFMIILRDGQTAQYASAVDPISGEAMKIDVTINVIK